MNAPLLHAADAIGLGAVEGLGPSPADAAAHAATVLRDRAADPPGARNT